MTSSFVARSIELSPMIWPRNGISVSSMSGAFASERVSGDAEPSFRYQTRASNGASARVRSRTRLIVPRPLENPLLDHGPVGIGQQILTRRVGNVRQQVRQSSGRPGSTRSNAGWSAEETRTRSSYGRTAAQVEVLDSSSDGTRRTCGRRSAGRRRLNDTPCASPPGRKRRASPRPAAASSTAPAATRRR